MFTLSKKLSSTGVAAAMGALALLASACGNSNNNSNWNPIPTPGPGLCPPGMIYGGTNGCVSVVVDFETTCFRNYGTIISSSSPKLCKVTGVFPFAGNSYGNSWTIPVNVQVHDRISVEGYISYNGSRSPSEANPTLLSVGGATYSYTTNGQEQSMTTSGAAQITLGGTFKDRWFDTTAYFNPQLRITRCQDSAGMSYPCP